MEDRSMYETGNCSIARTLEVVGEKWTPLILREAFFGAERFQDFHHVLQCPRSLLAARLDALVEFGVFERVPYKEPGSRTRHRYVLTPKGRDLVPLLLALLQWGDKHRADPAGPPVLALHQECGAPIRLHVSCANGHADLGADAIMAEPGPGAILADVG
jgi:DNA-binding HxlR family transcriptional regulator